MTARARGWVGIAAVIAIGLGLSLALTERYHHRILTLVFLWAAMGLAWNIISGYAGQISFGHQAFFGIGAYVTVLLAAKLQLTPWLGMWAGVGVAVLAALLIGTPTFRLAGIYFGLATLAYPLIFRIVMDYLGYQEVAIPMVRDRPALFMQFEEPRSFDLLALALLAATLVLSRLIEGSRLGYSLRAIKENEQAAEAMGVDAFRSKMLAYALSAAPAALAGAIYAHAILFVVTPDAVFGVIVIVQTLVVCLVGGAGTLWGPVIGAAIMIPVSEILDTTVGDRLPGIQGVVYGAALMAIMMWAPEGLFLSAFCQSHRPHQPRQLRPKRAQGKRHNAALICLARHRADFRYAMLWGGRHPQLCAERTAVSSPPLTGAPARQSL
jgi:ABC-type branched-subunit amino acid transport system permease subunit